MPVTSGTYMLEENITVTNCAYAETADQDITIDLNGHTITYVGSENLYVLGKVRGSDGDGTGSLMTRTTVISLTIMINDFTSYPLAYQLVLLVVHHLDHQQSYIQR